MVMTGLVKMCASVALGYAGSAVIWAVRLSNSKLADKSYRTNLLETVRSVGYNASIIAQAMEDGEISSEEESHIKESVQTVADKVKGLL